MLAEKRSDSKRAPRKRAGFCASRAIRSSKTGSERTSSGWLAKRRAKEHRSRSWDMPWRTASSAKRVATAVSVLPESECWRSCRPNWGAFVNARLKRLKDSSGGWTVDIVILGRDPGLAANGCEDRVHDAALDLAMLDVCEEARLPSVVPKPQQPECVPQRRWAFRNMNIGHDPQVLEIGPWWWCTDDGGVVKMAKTGEKESRRVAGRLGLLWRCRDSKDWRRVDASCCRT